MGFGVLRGYAMITLCLLADVQAKAFRAAWPGWKVTNESSSQMSFQRYTCSKAGTRDLGTELAWKARMTRPGSSSRLSAKHMRRVWDAWCICQKLKDINRDDWGTNSSTVSFGGLSSCRRRHITHSGFLIRVSRAFASTLPSQPYTNSYSIGRSQFVLHTSPLSAITAPPIGALLLLLFMCSYLAVVEPQHLHRQRWYRTTQKDERFREGFGWEKQ